MKTVTLKKDQDRRIRAGHLWIYSNEIDVLKSPLHQFESGEVVNIESARGNYLGVATLNPQALLCGRILSRSKVEINTPFFVALLQTALTLRQLLFAKPYCRLVYGESDLLPGLIIDRFNDIFVLQLNTAGMERLKDLIIEALIHLVHPRGIYLNNDTQARKNENLAQQNQIAYGEVPKEIEIEENQIRFIVPLHCGQKTGWYYDQRDNRALLQNLVAGKRVLDVYSYIGGFAMHAATYGAREVVCIESSAQACDYIKRNAQLNQHQDKITILQGDAIDLMKSLFAQQEKFDVVLLDPPAFIKKRADIKTGEIAYLRINHMAVDLLNPSGFLITSSCSMHMRREMLVEIIRRVGLKQQCLLQIIHHGFQAADHPIHPAITETAYLKTLFCRVAKSPLPHL